VSRPRDSELRVNEHPLVSGLDRFRCEAEGVLPAKRAALVDFADVPVTVGGEATREAARHNGSPAE
jgi:hypothetical protein